MAWELNVYAAVSVLSAAIAGALAVLVWRHGYHPTRRAFVALMAGLAIWATAYAIEIASTQPTIRWQQIAFVGAVVVPTAWLVLAARYSGTDGWLDRRAVTVLLVEPAVTLVLVWTTGYHDLVWRSSTTIDIGAVRTLDLAFGPWYWVNLIYSYGLVVAGLWLILKVYFTGNRLSSKQALVLFVGATVPLLANVAFTFGLSPLPGFDFTSLSFTVTGGLFAFALFRYRFLELGPVAREVMLDEMGDGVVVLDGDGDVVDFNEPGGEILTPSPETGVTFDERYPSLADDEQGRTLTTTVDGRPRDYDVRRRTLTNHRGEVVGGLVALRDVTVLKEHQQRLTVVNRVLRHNLRNEMNLVRGHADSIAAETSGATADRASDIGAIADDLVALGEQARRIDTTLTGSAAGRLAVDAVAVVEDVCRRHREDSPGARLTVDAPERATVLVGTEGVLASAVSNVIENAIEHNDSDTPRVAVTVEDEDDAVHVHVADNGPGIPEMERDVLEKSEEAPLEHGSGLGLWLVHWAVTRSGGRLSFAENTPRGSVVTLTFERAENDDGGAADSADGAV
jgi:signal transduction histidine kinase